MSTADLPGAERTFILGVGAQKAGTTWLHEYIVSAPMAAAGKLKEYHIWDALHVPLCDNYRTREEPRNDTEQLRAMMQQDQSVYFAFFDRLLELKGKSIAVDITPSYAGLGPDILRLIQDGFAARHIRTKAVFLMRDPVERCWSAARHAARLMQRSNTVREDVPGSKVARLSFNKHYEMRTRYDLTLASLTVAFKPEDLYVGIYETMFEPGQLRELSSFCGVPFRPELAEMTVHSSKKEEELGEDIRAAIARRYRIVYDTVAEAYPQVRNLWPGFAYL